MSSFSYTYEGRIDFTQPVERHDFLLRCLPCSTDCQRIKWENLTLQPDVSLFYDIDAFGNRLQYGHTLSWHKTFGFRACGEVELSAYAIADAAPLQIYHAASQLAMPSHDMVDFARSISMPGGIADDEKALIVAHAVHERMNYVPGSTTATTTAAEAFSQAQGVCQDFAHICIALYRLLGMKARYVAGFMPGEGQTHAWAEVWCDGRWIAFDPTNDLRVEEGYVKVAHGRDAADCPLNRGTIYGKAGQLMTVSVSCWQTII